MWHITQKITGKVGSALCKDTDFLNRFNAVVWDSDSKPFEFEEKWLKLISDFQLEDNEWLSTMFTDRKHWILAYHRDLPMGCILRTTQRSESANSFFKWYENHFGTQVEFWMRFQTAMDQQRYTQRCDDYDSDHSLPNLDTNIHLEKYGAIVYTHAVFKMLQEEVKAAILCGVADFDKEYNLRIIFVEDAEVKRTFKLDPNGNVIDDSNMAHSDNSLACKLWAEFSATVGVLKTLPLAHMDELASLLVEFREKLSVTPLTKDQEMEMLLGCSSSSEVTIRPPVKAHNKGSGKRLTSAKTQAIEKAAKPKRVCA
ncbi:protein FAR-RED IMPAIRED RESPONSE 1-like [Silene latifolia]|uniref:protein FAR-RED IMPAIRED RESPONSE 1-like n=1 Tax=Silene latifolia TaxID=37657 RepID=UPI003D7750EF